MSFRDQTAAQRLAMCNDIGEASYVDSLVAAALLRTLLRLPQGARLAARLEERYKVPLAGEGPSLAPLCSQPRLLGLVGGAQGTGRAAAAPLHAPWRRWGLQLAGSGP